MHAMNKNAHVKTLRAYFKLDKRVISQKPSNIAFQKRTIRRMERRFNKLLCKAGE